MFKEIPSLPGYYINPEGIIKNKNGKILKPHNHDCGYVRVGLDRINGKQKKCYIHRLVAETFIPNPLNKPQVNHIDGNKLNNNLSNLEWCTAKENTRHAMSMGLKKTSTKEMIAKNKVCGVWNKGIKYGETEAYKKANASRNLNYLQRCEFVVCDRISGMSIKDLSIKYNTCTRQIHSMIKKYKEFNFNKQQYA